MTLKLRPKQRAIWSRWFGEEQVVALIFLSPRFFRSSIYMASILNFPITCINGSLLSTQSACCPRSMTVNWEVRPVHVHSPSPPPQESMGYIRLTYTFCMHLKIHTHHTSIGQVWILSTHEALTTSILLLSHFAINYINFRTSRLVNPVHVGMSLWVPYRYNGMFWHWDCNILVILQVTSYSYKWFSKWSSIQTNLLFWILFGIADFADFQIHPALP